MGVFARRGSGDPKMLWLRQLPGFARPYTSALDFG